MNEGGSEERWRVSAARNRVSINLYTVSRHWTEREGHIMGGWQSLGNKGGKEGRVRGRNKAGVGWIKRIKETAEEARKDGAEVWDVMAKAWFTWKAFKKQQAPTHLHSNPTRLGWHELVIFSLSIMYRACDKSPSQTWRAYWTFRQRRCYRR